MALLLRKRGIVLLIFAISLFACSDLKEAYGMKSDDDKKKCDDGKVLYLSCLGAYPGNPYANTYCNGPYLALVSACGGSGSSGY
ncbi:hypothetical protein CH373_05420 [Leptospira perolatii]|uniref:Lipoprotein n=1 Tax=Leptospira perolatii TaxID=2023191 RepID=A0A2M9ZQJ6_9LEPT|nr:hypothetical protein [Leptospira perolatii]PJZ70509.1 hypothetical protein CH360_05840 [Leptospira perolatii]PJZ74346.1 hypothetical protein CH373_05420 [Leptospira perolatii]